MQLFLFPQTKDDQDNIEDDITLLETLMQNGLVKLSPWGRITKPIKMLSNKNVVKDDGLIMYYHEVIIPVMVYIRKAYRKAPQEFIRKLQMRMTSDYTLNNSNNKYFRYLLMIVTTQFFVYEYPCLREISEPQVLSNIDIELLKWLSQN